MTDFSSQIDLITSKLSEQLNTLELEYQRWSDYKTDYDALENQLRTLPENTTKSAMVRLNSRSIFRYAPTVLLDSYGKISFYAGKIDSYKRNSCLVG